MSAKEKTPTREATRAEAAETAAFSGAAVPCVDSNTSASGRQIQVSDFLLRRQENAVPRRHLRQLTGFSDRELRKRIELERRAGIAICADNLSGYYLAADELEKRQFVNSMLHRAAEIAKTAAAIEEAELD